MNINELARLGYVAYAKNTDGKTYDGKDMPKWEDLPLRTVAAWEAAVMAIREGMITVRA